MDYPEGVTRGRESVKREAGEGRASEEPDRHGCSIRCAADACLCEFGSLVLSARGRTKAQSAKA